MPTKLIIERTISNPIAEIIIGIFTNSAKYPPNPRATVAAVIIEVIAVSQPIKKAKKFEFSDLALDVARILRFHYGAIESDRMAVTLRQLSPSQSGYTRLRQALRWYRQIAASGGWPQIPAGPTLQRGDHDERVRALPEKSHSANIVPLERFPLWGMAMALPPVVAS